MADKLVLTTPTGVAVYPRLSKPDTKYNDNGQYKADLRVPTDEAAPLIDKLRKLYKDHTGKVLTKNPERDNRSAFYYIELDDEGEATGNVVFKLRVTNKINKKTGELWDRRPAQFDSRGKPFTKPKNISGGSKLKVSFEVYLWANADGSGMSLQPLAVQVIDLVEYTGQNLDASSYGFGEEDGYADDGDDYSAGFSDESGADDGAVPAGEDDY